MIGGSSAATSRKGMRARGRESGSRSSNPTSCSATRATSSTVRAKTPSVSSERREGQDAVARDEPVRRLEAVDAAEGRRPDHGAVGLAADRDRHHAGRHRGRRAAGGAAGRVRGVVRVPRLARGVGRELRGHGLAHDHRARRAEHRHHGGVPGRRPPRVEHGPVLGRHVGGVDDVLHSDGHAVERSERPARQPVLVGRGRLRPREVGVEEGPGLDLRIHRLDAGQARVDQLRGADHAVADQPRRVRSGERVEVGQIHPVVAGPGCPARPQSP